MHLFLVFFCSLRLDIWSSLLILVKLTYPIQCLAHDGDHRDRDCCPLLYLTIELLLECPPSCWQRARVLDLKYLLQRKQTIDLGNANRRTNNYKSKLTILRIWTAIGNFIFRFLRFLRFFMLLLVFFVGFLLQ